MTHNGQTNSDGGGRDTASQRRRLESEMIMFQSDRGKLLRKKEEFDVEKRVLAHELIEKEREINLKEDEIRKVVSEIQAIDTELLRLKRHMNAL